MSTKFVEPLIRITETVIDRFADAVVGKASTLRDGTEHAGVELPRDLYAHESAQTEWWYYTGHMQTESGGRFGFELVFFKRRTDLDRFGVVPLRLIANPLYFAHFAIADEERMGFRYEHQKSGGGAFDLRAQASTRAFRLQLGNWSVRESGNGGAHLLRATLGCDLIFEASLRSMKPVVLNGHEGSGVSFKDRNEASRYFSLTRMKAEGRITWHGRTENFTGSAWMDREFGTWQAKDNHGWDWFSLQLETGAEVMVYHLRNLQGAPSPFSSGTYVDVNGASAHLAREDFMLEMLEHRRSPRTAAVYPSRWRLRVPRFELDVEIAPVMPDQELDTRGTTMIVYWEGACLVRGTHKERVTKGRAYAELVGYDRSHEQPSLGAFLFGDALDKGWRSIFG
jgi:predicted secreted hydrolase